MDLFYVPAALGAVTYLLKNLLYYLHMLQLSSYKNERYLSWCKKHQKKLIQQALWVLIPGIAISAVAIYSIPLSCILLTLLFLVASVTYKLPPAKKPLGYTPRIKRLMVTSVITAVLIMLMGYRMSAVFLFLLAGSSAPLMALLSNILNTPIERMVYLWYFNDARKKLAEHKNLIVIGVTGSYGKTSTKFALGQLLSVGFNTLITPESYNTPMGLCKVIRNQLSAAHEVFVAEMGAGKVGDIAELCKLVSPDHGVICSIGPQHLETMGSMENIIKTKFSLADHVFAKGGTVFLNYDNDIIANHPVQGGVIRYGTTAGLDFWADDVRADEKGTTFTLFTRQGERYPCKTRLLGRHNVLNILAAVSVGRHLGIPVERMLPAVEGLEPVPHRLQLISRPDGITLIDDAYNANPNGAKMALETLGCFMGMRILITPGMVGLGTWEKELNKEFGAYAAEHCDLMILVGGDRVLPIASGAKEAGFDPKKILRCPTVDAALAEAESYRSQKPVVLLENDLPDNYS